MANIIELTAAFNRADAAGDTEAAQEFHDAIVALQTEQAAPPPAPEPPPAAAAPAQQGAMDLFNQALAGGALNPDVGAEGLLAPLGTEAGRAGAMRGVTFGLSDQLGGIKDWLTTGGALTPQQALTRYKARQEAMMAADPGSAAGGEMLGMGATVPLGGLSAARATAGPVAAAAAKTFREAVPALAKVGAGYGGVAGAGMSPTSIIEDPLGVLPDAAMGALIGSTLSLAIPGGIAAGGAVGRYLAKRIGELRGLEPRAQQLSLERIRKLIEDRGLTAPDLAAMEQKNPALMAADVTPDLQLLAAEASAGNKPESRTLAEAINYRDQTVRDRVDPQLKALLDVAPDAPGFIQQGKILSAKKASLARPLYDQAETIDTPVTDTINYLITHNDDVGAAYKTARNDAMTEMKLRAAENPDTYGKIPLPQVPPSIMQHQEALKNLSGKIGEAARTGNLTDMRRLTRAKTLIRDEVERNNPAFAQAQQVWGSVSADEAALETGRNVFAYLKDWDALQADVLAPMGASERDQFNVGVMRALQEKLSGVSDRANEVTAISRNNNARQLLYTVLGNDATKVKRLHEMLDTESDMFRTFELASRAQKSPQSKTVAGEAAAARTAEQAGSLAGIAAQTGIPGFAFGTRMAAAQQARKFTRKQEEAVRIANARNLLLSPTAPQLMAPGAGVRAMGPLAQGSAQGAVMGGLLGSQLPFGPDQPRGPLAPLP